MVLEWPSLLDLAKCSKRKPHMNVCSNSESGCAERDAAEENKN